MASLGKVSGCPSTPPPGCACSLLIPPCGGVLLEQGCLGPPLSPSGGLFLPSDSLKDFLPKEYIKQKGERKIFMVSGSQGKACPSRILFLSLTLLLPWGVRRQLGS